MTLMLGLLVVAAAVARGQGPDADYSHLPQSIARFLNNRSESLTQFRAVRHLEATSVNGRPVTSDEIAAVR